MKKFLLAVFSLAIYLSSFGAIEKGEGEWNAVGDKYIASFDAKGLLKSFEFNGKKILVNNGESLCSITLNGKEYFSKDAIFKGSGIENGIAFFDYEFTGKADVRVFLEASSDYFDVWAKIKSNGGLISSVSIPRNYILNPKDLKAVTILNYEPKNMGMELTPSFFMPRTDIESNTANLERGAFNHGQAHTIVYGEAGRYEKDSYGNALTLGKDGKEWLGNDAEKFISEFKVNPSRPINPKFVDINIAESKNGAFIAGTKFGGKGALFRFGGFIDSNDYDKTSQIQAKILRKLYLKAVKDNPNRKKVSVINFNIAGSVSRAAKMRWEFFIQDRRNFSVLKSQDDLIRAMQDPEMLMIVNPYEEACPTVNGKSLNEFVGDIKNFVKQGGYWLEVGGNPFSFDFVKSKYLSVITGFMGDFTHFKMKNLRFSISSPQPVKDKDFYKDLPWISSYTVLAGTDKGANIRRGYRMWILKDREMLTPKTRIRFGENFIDSAKSFCDDNKTYVKFEDKASKDVVEKLKKSLIIRIDGPNTRWAWDWFEKMPVPALIHCSHFLRGGFDEQYPDMLPPNKRYAPSDEEFRNYLKRIRQKGSLFMPYTNNTWWCDKPKGETFIKYGNVALVHDDKGNLSPERYAYHYGFTACMWHPVVREVDEKVFGQFKTDYPADIIFQDQIGSRCIPRFDFNKANPQAPNSYLDGIIQNARHNCKNLPLATEEIFFPLFDYEIMLTGYNFGVFHPRDPDHFSVDRKFLWEVFPKDAVKMANYVGALAHDKMSITHHNLDGNMINFDRQISMSLAYGIHLFVAGGSHNAPKFKEEDLDAIYWIDAIQKNIAYHYIGAEMKRFKHKWVNEKSCDGDSIISARYSDVKVYANASSKSRTYKRFTVAPDSFIAEAPNAIAGGVLAIGKKTVKATSMFIVKYENNNKISVFAYGNGGNDFIFPLDRKIEKLTYNGKELEFSQDSGVVRIKLPVTDKKHRTFYVFDGI